MIFLNKTLNISFFHKTADFIYSKIYYCKLLKIKQLRFLKSYLLNSRIGIENACIISA